MGIVRTIHGDVDPSTLGVVNAHDHLIRVGAGEVYIDPDHLLVDEDKAAQEAAYFVEASKRFAPTATIVDMCPASSGRGVVKLKRVVDRVPDLQVVAATGFHQQKVYLEWRQSWANQYTVTEIADLLIADVVETGTTLRAAGLETFGDAILVSEAVLITTEQFRAEPGLATLVRRLEGVLRARAYVLVDYDIPMNKLHLAAALTPGIESPTVSPLQNPDWVAVRAMVPRADMNRVMDELYEVGARAILVSELLACRL